MKFYFLNCLSILYLLVYLPSLIAQENKILPNGTYYLESPVIPQRLVSLGITGNAKMEDKTTDANQQWIFTQFEGNVYTIQNKGTKGFLEVPFGECEDGLSVQTWEFSKDPHQRWELGTKDNYYTLRPTHCLDRALDRNFGNANANAIVFQFDGGANINQNWAIKSIDVIDSETIILHPNPVNQKIIVEGLDNQPNQIQIVDRVGRLIFTRIMDRSNNNLDISNLQGGVYFFIQEGGDVKSFLKI